MDSGQFNTYFIQDGKWVEGHHSLAVGFSFLFETGNFQKRVPGWFFYLELYERVKYLRKARELKRPLPDFKGVLYFPLNLPIDIGTADKGMLKHALGLINFSEN